MTCSRLLPWIVAFSCLFTSEALAAPKSRVTPKSESVEAFFSNLLLGTQKHQLDNGLNVVLQVDRNVPGVAVAVTFAVGASAEAVLGAALVELVDDLRHRRLPAPHNPDHALGRARASLEDTESGWDHTSFVQVLPSSELPFALWREAQRLNRLSQVPPMARRRAQLARHAWSLLHPERQGWLWLHQLMAGAQQQITGAPASGPRGDQQGPPPQTPPSDNTAAALGATFFAAERAVLTVVGDFDPDEAMRLLAHFFEGSPKRSPPSPVWLGADPSPSSHQQSLPTPRTNFHALFVGFRTPPATHPDHAALTVAAHLVAPDVQLASFMGAAGPLEPRPHDLSAVMSDGRTTGVLAFLGSVTSSSQPRKLTHLLRHRLDTLARQAPRQIVASAKQRALTHWLSRFVSPAQRAATLGRYQALHGDARLATRVHQALMGVTPEDVQRVVRQNLGPAARFELGVGLPLSEEP